MFTDIKQVQIIVSLLKQFNIRHFVISPGTRHVPLVHAVEIDSFFECYSVVDERSAAYLALGLAEALDSPVCVTCTSATASCNYMPAMQEAYEKGIQLVALTADRARMQRFHGENQCINQVDMYQPYCKYSVDVPNVQNAEEFWYCNRCVNEALLELNHHGKGPVQINFLEPLSIGTLSTFNNEVIPICRKIDRYDLANADWSKIKEVLKDKNKILVLAGQQQEKSGELLMSLRNFNAIYNTAITYDHFANIQCEDFIQSSLLSECLNEDQRNVLKPDLIISFGTKIYSWMGSQYRDKGIEHWYIDESGVVYDPIHSLKNVFEMTPATFFANVNKDATTSSDKQYYSLWKSYHDTLDTSLDDYTNHLVIRETLKRLPYGSNLHVSVLNSMRFSNYYKLPEKTLCFGNICADGIDGALSTFLGQASQTDKISLLIVGDLSYLYDLNAAVTKFPSNIRVLLVNNQAGAEFHFNIGKERIETLDKHIAAGHKSTFNSISSFSGFLYMHASNIEELNSNLDKFFSKSDKAILMEVSTDADNDGYSLRNFWNKNRSLSKRDKIIKYTGLKPFLPFIKKIVRLVRG